MALLFISAFWLVPLGAALLSLVGERRWVLGILMAVGLGLMLIWGWAYTHLRAGHALEASVSWFRIGAYEVSYYVGITWENIWLLLLTILVGGGALFYDLAFVPRLRGFAGLMYLLISAVMGAFLARDLVLFFVFYEASLVPAFLLIYHWGGSRRQSAAIRFALFTLGGSVFILLGLLWGLRVIGSAGWGLWHAGALPIGAAVLMTVGFSAKLPLFPLHSWLGEAHVEAATPVSMVLAGILLKLGGYGLLSWSWVGLPVYGQWVIVGWSLVSLFYAIGVATAQVDLKRLVAFTSISHMAYVGLGGAVGGFGSQGAYLQLFMHGIVSAGLFAWAGLLEKNWGTRDIGLLSGALQTNRRWAMYGLALFAAAIGVPGFGLFISEFLVLWGLAQKAGWLITATAASSLIFTGFYFLRAYQKLMIGEGGRVGAQLLLAPQEAVILVLLALAVVSGMYPQPWLYVGS